MIIILSLISQLAFANFKSGDCIMYKTEEFLTDQTWIYKVLVIGKYNYKVVFDKYGTLTTGEEPIKRLNKEFKLMKDGCPLKFKDY